MIISVTSKAETLGVGEVNVKFGNQDNGVLKTEYDANEERVAALGPRRNG
jgi:hypothetical protein